ncbi:hypothetical protein HXX76_006724 [Chlamydomonas incerta]|uniref:Uncharacterized protein n=1 Tax=Chlamydomonas incerta TaxID=51695 RepID=A0A835W231_CHLIN|nr:hypothetical protein HXX76_006724 [Chlamydomonas incerta]|eukprot:KAG2436420.1 hypothetical protein HXX76_006724 [Chlamydomonas incerta]
MLPELLRVLPPDARQKVLGDSFSRDMAACRRACRELRQLCDDAVSHVTLEVCGPASGALSAALARLFHNFTRLALHKVETERCVAAALEGLPAAVRQRLSGITVTPTHEWGQLDYAAILDVLATGPLRLPALLQLKFVHSTDVMIWLNLGMGDVAAAAAAARLPRLLAAIGAAWPRLQALSLPRLDRFDLAAAVGALAAGLPHLRELTLTLRSKVTSLTEAALQSLGRLSCLEALSLSCLSLPRALFKPSGGGGGSDPALLQRLMARAGLPRLRRLRLSAGGLSDVELELDYGPGLGAAGPEGWGIAAVRLRPAELMAVYSTPPPTIEELHRLDVVAALVLGAAEELPAQARGGAATLEALCLEDWLEEALDSCCGGRRYHDLLPEGGGEHVAAPAARVLLLQCETGNDAAALAELLSAAAPAAAAAVGQKRRRRQQQRNGKGGGAGGSDEAHQAAVLRVKLRDKSREDGGDVVELRMHQVLMEIWARAGAQAGGGGGAYGGVL